MIDHTQLFKFQCTRNKNLVHTSGIPGCSARLALSTLHTILSPDGIIVYSSSCRSNSSSNNSNSRMSQRSRALEEGND